MRPIDAEALYTALKDAGMVFALRLVEATPTIAPPPNGPLTLEELREIDGEPVWYVFPGADTLTSAGGFFCLCCKGEIIGPSGHSFDCALLDGRFYRRRPEEGKP